MAESKIIDKILSDAKERADDVVLQAEAKAKAILDGVVSELNAWKAEVFKRLDGEEEAVAVRRETVARLEARKIELGAKQKVIDEVFKRALNKLIDLSEKEYQNVIVGMLDYAEDGDIVTVNKTCKSMLPKVFFTSYAKLKGIKLGYNTAGGNFEGGMILSNGKVDKNFTFEAELRELREKLMPEIVAKLF